MLCAQDQGGPAGPATQPEVGPGSDPLAPQSSGVKPLGSIASGAVVALIPVHGMIHDFTVESLKRRTDQALALGATWIVFDLNTFGGRMDSAMDASKYIKSLGRPTLAWVNPNAYSAGSLLAAACTSIVMAPSSAFGDCAPIVPGGDLAPTERAKALSPLLEEFADSARKNGYDFAVFHAMCVLGVEVYLIEHKDSGVRRLVNQADYGVMVEGRSPGPGVFGTVMKKFLPQNAAGAPTIDQVAVDLATEADRKQWNLVKRVHNGTTLLTIHQDRAFEIGLARNDPGTQPLRADADMKTFLNASRITRVRQHWGVNLAYFLCTPIVRGFLVLVFVVALYLELQAPGIGVGGITALVALGVLLGAPYLIGFAETWHLILFVLGLGMLLLEVLVVPGFGVLGAAGIISMFIGLVLMVVPTTGQGFMPMPLPGRGDVIRQSVMWTLLGLLGASVVFYFLVRYFGNIPLMNHLVLRDPSPAWGRTSEGRTISIRPPETRLSGDEAIGAGSIQVGAVGRSTTRLRPSGRAEIEGHVLDVVTLGGWIDAGTPVRVCEVQGNRVVVEE